MYTPVHAHIFSHSLFLPGEMGVRIGALCLRSCVVVFFWGLLSAYGLVLYFSGVRDAFVGL